MSSADNLHFSPAFFKIRIAAFSPGAGTPPPELAGRQDILEQANVLLQRIQKGRAA